MWTIKLFDELTTKELFVIYRLRVGVFVVVPIAKWMVQIYKHCI